METYRPVVSRVRVRVPDPLPASVELLSLDHARDSSRDSLVRATARRQRGRRYISGHRGGGGGVEVPLFRDNERVYVEALGNNAQPYRGNPGGQPAVSPSGPKRIIRRRRTQEAAGICLILAAVTNFGEPLLLIVRLHNVLEHIVIVDSHTLMI